VTRLSESLLLWQSLGMSNGSNFGAIDTGRQRLLAVARRLLRTEADAEDAVQDAYLRAAGSRSHSPDSMQAWLHMVVRNLAIDQLRRERLKRAYLETATPPELLAGVDVESSAEHAVAMKDECVAALYDLHRRVSREEAAAILLREVFEADYSDIARAAGKTESATRQLVHRALTRVHCVTPSAGRRGGAVDDEDSLVRLCWHAIQSRNPAVLFQMMGSPHVTAQLPAAPLVRGGLGVPRASCALVHIHGRYAIALVLDGVVLCTVPVGPTENAPASTIE
jgi:RNA polymerase sigma factor (sigma-70 family)